MSLKEKLFDSKVSRRSFLKGMAAVGTTAALYGCGSGGDGAASYKPVVGPSADLEFDHTVEPVWGTHPHNCGGRCPHKFFVKDYGKKTARIVKSTSAGDIPREDSLEKDEDINKIQIRGCVRGYAQVKRTYSPDRLKYPLIQTKERGDLTGFKRVSWDEALDKVASMVEEVYNRYKSGELPYIPMVAGPPNGLHNAMMFAGMKFSGFAEGAGTALAEYLGPTILPTGAPSFENMLFAAIGSVGLMPALIGGNHPANYLKSNFIIQWGADPAVKEPNKTFFLTKAKEAKIPIVTIDARFTDTAAQLSTGFPEYNLPKFIQLRPQTDGALATAMAYVIYKNGWHDDDFIKNYCYGFYPTQEDVGNDSDGKPFKVVEAPKYRIFPNPDPETNKEYPEVPFPLFNKTDFSFSIPLTKDQHPLADEALYGQPLHVPKGMSFVEYLDDLGVKKANEYNLSTSDEDAKINAVLRWASELTGIDKDTIYNLARAFSNEGDLENYAVFLEHGNNGGQKTNNGMFNCWLTICLTAMCGHSIKDGGNIGVNTFDGTTNPVTHPEQLTYPQLGKDNKPYPFIAVDSNQFVDLVVKGRDGRSKKEFYYDIKSIYGIDLLNNKDIAIEEDNEEFDPKLEVDMVFGGYHITNSINTCPNTNKAVNIFTKKKPNGEYLIKHYVIYEQFMTPTAAYADVILPACSHHEKPFFTSGQAFFYQNKLIEPMYDTKGDSDIDEMLADRLNISYTKNGKTDDELLKEIWDDSDVSGIEKKPTFEELKEVGYVQRPLATLDLTNPMVELMNYLPYLTESGKIQFFSPFYFYRNNHFTEGKELNGKLPEAPDENSGVYRVTPMARYVEPYEGYENILRGENVGVRGVPYPLQFTTKHARNRAHTVYDNVSMIRDQFDYPKRAIMHPVDAAQRGIEDGDYAYIYNDWGCMKVRVERSNRQKQGVVDLPHGVWYRPGNETVTVWYDIDLGNAEGTKEVEVVENNKVIKKTYYKYTMKVDVGGCENGLTHDKSVDCPRDPLCGQVGNNHFNGNLCEVSKVKPQ